MNSSAPIFVIGSYRSGTSIFAWCLGQHPNIVNLPETNWLARFALELGEIYRVGCVNDRHSHIGQLQLSRYEFYQSFGNQVDRFIARTNKKLINRTERRFRKGAGELRRKRNQNDPKQRWVDATPENTHYVYGLKLLFPEARFIHLLRNPHEVARSLEKFSRVGNRDYSKSEAYETWARLASTAEQVEYAFGSQTVLRVTYEELMTDPEGLFRRVFEFLGEEYSADSLLPLQKKINTSAVDDDNKKVDSQKAYVMNAENLYQRLTSAGQYQGQGQPEPLKKLEETFWLKADALHNPATIAARGARQFLSQAVNWVRRRLTMRRINSG